MKQIAARTISSWQTTLALLIIYAIAMAIATFVETKAGTQTAKIYIYHSIWFAILQLAMIINFIALSIKLKIYSRRRWSIIALHWAFIIIMLGAYITHITGYEGIMHIRKGQSSNQIVTNGNKLHTVPFSITLNNFSLERYRGSNSPSSYKSDVTINYKGENKSHLIYMNNIANIGGFRLYQTSYDQDEQGTVLTVNYDPWGTTLTYIGYFILIISIFLALFDRKSAFRATYKSLNKTGIVLALLLSPISLTAQEIKSFYPSEQVGEKFGELVVQTPQGRIEPLSSYTSELLRKLYHSSKYKGLKPEQVISGIITSPEAWANEPLIYISRGKYITFNSLFNENGEYKHSKQIEEIFSKSPAGRTKEEKDLIKIDEKANILFSLLSNQYMPIFPTDNREQWYSQGEDLSAINGKDSLFIAKILEWYKQETLNSNDRGAIEVIEMINKYQRAKTHEGYINDTKIKAELLYNKAKFFTISFRAFLILGGILLILTLFAHKNNRTIKQLSTLIVVLIAATLLYQTIGIAMRWYISGRAPWTNGYESILHVAWIAVLASLFLYKRFSPITALGTLLAGVILFVANLNWLDPQITPLVPVLKSYWLMIHVSVIMASYGLFALGAICSLGTLVSMAAGCEKKEFAIINKITLTIGLALLTAGVFFGAVWANESWGRYWGWDPKETWALITMIIYAIAIHCQFIPSLRNNFIFSILSLVGIISVLMTYFGVSIYLSGMHSYGGMNEIPVHYILIPLLVITILSVVAGVRFYKFK